MCCQNSLLEELNVSCITPLGEDLDACTWFPPDFYTCAFSLCLYDCMLSTVSPSIESVNLDVVLGIPDIFAIMELTV